MYVYLEGGYTAVLYPKVTGGWVVATVLEPEMAVKDGAGESKEAV